MFTLDPEILSLIIAFGIGLLVGTERERRKGQGAQRTPAGLRTFTVASVIGAVSYMVGRELLLAVVTGGVFAVTAVAYRLEHDDDLGLTTGIALVATVLLGGLAVSQPRLAAGIAVAITIVLNARSELHRFVRSVLSEAEVRDALTFAAASLIVLPLLPNEEMGPLQALNPRAIWIIVILVMAIGGLGHIAVRAAGARFGLPVAGLASGFISSVATVGTMGARAAKTPGLLWPAIAGAALSSLATPIQMALLLAVTNIETLRVVQGPLACAFAAALTYGLIVAIRAFRENPGDVGQSGHAFSPWAALLFAATLGLILLASKVLHQWYGRAGVLVATAVAGFASADPPMISVASLVAANEMAASDAAIPILIAFTTNVITKVVVAMTSGKFQFAAGVIPGLILMTLAAWGGLWLQP